MNTDTQITGIYDERHWDGPGAMIYISSFIKIDSGIQKLIW
jgi:hypothetical protein